MTEKYQLAWLATSLTANFMYTLMNRKEPRS